MKIVVIIVELSSEMFKAHCPAMPGCLVLGGSRQEALDRMSKAVAGYVASFDATSPEKLDLEVVERAWDAPRAVRDGSRTASVVPKVLSPS